MRYFIILISTILLSCNLNQENENRNAKTYPPRNSDIKISSTENLNSVSSNTEIIETIVDSLNVGEKGRCKIELIKHRVYDDYFIIVKFFIKIRRTIKDPETWMRTNTYCYETNAYGLLEPNISDFNNDHFNDITIISGEAARGANEIRRLFIYDNQNNELISIVNSEDYPNMLYNKELDCIDAFLVYGGCSTVFLHIEGDSLKEFASVELQDGLRVTTYDKKGKEKIIKEDKSNKSFLIRYKNFNPLKEYDNE